jgi:hypothetical protein
MKMEACFSEKSVDLQRTKQRDIPADITLHNNHCENLTSNCFFFFFSHGVRLSTLGTAATVWPIVSAPHDR